MVGVGSAGSKTKRNGSVAAVGASASTHPGADTASSVDAGGQSGRSRHPPPPVTKIRTAARAGPGDPVQRLPDRGPLPSPCVHGPTTSATSAPRSRSVRNCSMVCSMNTSCQPPISSTGCTASNSAIAHGDASTRRAGQCVQPASIVPRALAQHGVGGGAKGQLSEDWLQLDAASCRTNRISTHARARRAIAPRKAVGEHERACAPSLLAEVVRTHRHDGQR